MKKITEKLRLALPAMVFLAATAWAGEPWLTTTLLPMDKSAPLKNVPLTIESKKTTFQLEFDLMALPDGLSKEDFKNATLRLVADGPGKKDLLVKGRLPNAPDSIVLLNQLIGKNLVALNSLAPEDACNPPADLQAEPGTSNTEGVCDLLNALSDHYENRREQAFTLELFSESGNDAKRSFHSNRPSADSPSDIPRLVIEYTRRPPGLLDNLDWRQKQRDPEHTGRTPWAPFNESSGFTVTAIKYPDIEEIQDYPLIHRGNLYVVAKGTNDIVLAVLDSKGNKLQRHSLGQFTLQRPPVISRAGFLYLLTKESILAYDLAKLDGQFAVFKLPPNSKASDRSELTVGDDGSLFLVLKKESKNYVYGFTESLKPFLRREMSGEHASSVTVGRGGREIAVDTEDKAEIIDIRNPSSAREITKLEHYEHYKHFHLPVAAPDGHYIFAGFSDTPDSGIVSGHDDTETAIWTAKGTSSSQPVLAGTPSSQTIPKNGEPVYFIQDGRLQAQPYKEIRPEPTAGGSENNWKTTSNLVMDGGNNVYFLSDGYLVRCAPPKMACQALKKEGSGHEQFVRLTLGPDGTLWANNNKGKTLYALRPTYASPDLNLSKLAALTSGTVYRAEGKLSVGGPTVGDSADKAGAQVLLQAERISFGPGFAVRRGASLLCRTGSWPKPSSDEPLQNTKR